MPGVIVDVLKRGYACSWRDSDLPKGLPSGRYVMVSGP
jgi:hypothetical protein